MKYKTIEQDKETICTTEAFIGQSLEEKVYQAVNSKAPIEAVAPMVYTERKDGVLPETNIRTDRFEIAQEAMTTIANGVREKRAKRILEGSADKPDTNSGSPEPTSVQN